MRRRGYRPPSERVVRRPRGVELEQVVFTSTTPRRKRRFLDSPWLIMYSLGGLIVVGTVLLVLPVSNTLMGNALTPLEVALFTATSAVTVTGLTVVPTYQYWTFFGQLVIFFLMLIGGLGFMTLVSFMLIIFGQRITLPERLVMRENLGLDRLGGLIRLTRSVIMVAFLFYALGTGVIYFRLVETLREPTEALWQSVFLAVSAFNNAGFSALEGSSVEAFADDYAFLGVMMFLIAAGSVSWTVLLDLWRNKWRISRYALDTKLVLTLNLLLWGAGAGILLLDGLVVDRGFLGGWGPAGGVVQSLFHSVSARTAGFSTLNLVGVGSMALLFLAGLMFVGGAAGSTAGGIKVNTLGVLLAAVWASVRGRPSAEIFRREIPQEQVYRALAIAVLSLTAVFAVALVLTTLERKAGFLNLLFETVSAFGTVGLSTGITAELRPASHYILAVLMFVGRIGPITLALAIAPRPKTVYRYVQERVKLG